MRAVPGSHHRPARHRGGRQSACIVRAPRGRGTGRGGKGSGRRVRGSARFAPLRDPLRPSLRETSSSFVPSLRSPPGDPRPERKGGEGRKWGARAAEGSWGTRLPRRVPQPDPCPPRSPRTPASWQGGRPLPRAPSRARWPRLHSPPRPILGRLWSVSLCVTQSTSSLLGRPVSSAAHSSSSTAPHLSPPISAALGSVPPAPPIRVPPPNSGPRQPSPGPRSCYCWDHSPS